jgi:hypothetical protein
MLEIKQVYTTMHGQPIIKFSPKCFQWILCFWFSNQNFICISYLPNKYHMFMLPFAAHLNRYCLTAQIVSG